MGLRLTIFVKPVTPQAIRTFQMQIFTALVAISRLASTCSIGTMGLAGVGWRDGEKMQTIVTE